MLLYLGATPNKHFTTTWFSANWTMSRWTVTMYSILMLLYLIRTMLTALLPCQYVSYTRYGNNNALKHIGSAIRVITLPINIDKLVLEM
jgi:hypothetical protein